MNVKNLLDDYLNKDTRVTEKQTQNGLKKFVI